MNLYYLFLDDQLAQEAYLIMSIRQEKIVELEPYAQQCYQEVSSGQEVLSIQYKPSWDVNMQQEAISKDSILQKIQIARRREIEQKSTLFGIHRDDIIIHLNNKLSVSYASQGQKRLISLCLKLACSKLLQHHLNKMPILLLDDVFAELDEQRRNLLKQVVSKNQQIIIASPRAEDIPFKVDNIIKIYQGKQV